MILVKICAVFSVSVVIHNKKGFVFCVPFGRNMFSKGIEFGLCITIQYSSFAIFVFLSSIKYP
jgi:hypothetical protein